MPVWSILMLTGLGFILVAFTFGSINIFRAVKNGTFSFKRVFAGHILTVIGIVLGEVLFVIGIVLLAVDLLSRI